MNSEADMKWVFEKNCSFWSWRAESHCWAYQICCNQITQWIENRHWLKEEEILGKTMGTEKILGKSMGTDRPKKCWWRGREKSITIFCWYKYGGVLPLKKIHFSFLFVSAISLGCHNLQSVLLLAISLLSQSLFCTCNLSLLDDLGPHQQ